MAAALLSDVCYTARRFPVVMVAVGFLVRSHVVLHRMMHGGAAMRVMTGTYADMQTGGFRLVIQHCESYAGYDG